MSPTNRDRAQDPRRLQLSAVRILGTVGLWRRRSSTLAGLAQRKTVGAIGQRSRVSAQQTTEGGEGLARGRDLFRAHLSAHRKSYSQISPEGPKHLPVPMFAAAPILRARPARAEKRAWTGGNKKLTRNPTVNVEAFSRRESGAFRACRSTSPADILAPGNHRVSGRLFSGLPVEIPPAQEAPAWRSLCRYHPPGPQTAPQIAPAQRPECGISPMIGSSGSFQQLLYSPGREGLE